MAVFLIKRAAKRGFIVITCIYFIKIFMLTILDESDIDEMTEKYQNEISDYLSSSEAPLENLEPLMRGNSLSNEDFDTKNEIEIKGNDKNNFHSAISLGKNNLTTQYFRKDSSHNRYQNFNQILNSTEQYWSDPLPRWLRVSDDLFLYSGFWDPRDLGEESPAARVLGIIRYNKSMLVKEKGFITTGFIKDEWLPYSCSLWYKTHKTEGHLKAFMFEEGLKAFVGTYFLCYPDNSTKQANISETPYAVSISPTNVTDYPNKIIHLIDNYKEFKGKSINVNDILARKSSIESYKDSFNNSNVSVCVRALFGPYDDLQGMVQFISYYNIVLGIKHFYFYELAISLRVRKWLDILENFDIHVHLLPWNLPTGNWDELWDFGSLTAINDCNYRSAGRHAFTIFVDLDEFLAPKDDFKSIHDMYKKILKHKRGTFGDTALIPNAFFCEEFEDILNEEDIFPIFKYTKREGRLWPPKSRSKMIVVPETVISVGHHMVHHFINKVFNNRASPKLYSALHHYRACAGLRHGIHATGSQVLEHTPITDKSIFKFKSKIMGSELIKLYNLMKLNL